MDISFLLAGVIIGSIAGFFIGKYSIYKALSTCEKEKIEKGLLKSEIFENFFTLFITNPLALF